MDTQSGSPFGDSLKKEIEELDNLLDSAIKKAVTHRERVSYVTDTNYEEVRNKRNAPIPEKVKPGNWENLKDSTLDESWRQREHELEAEDTRKARKVVQKKNKDDDWDDDPF